MHKGIFITMEGPDGAGKSTQIQFIKKFLESKGYTVVLTREPGGTDISEKIREITLDRRNIEMCDRTEALLYAASRAQHVGEVILPALKEGKVVLCDRFVDSSLVYQGKGRNLGIKEIEAINNFATMGLEPDITILLDLDPKIGLNRATRTKEADRIEQENLDFHKQVYKGYMDLAAIYPERIKAIKADKSIGEVSNDIKNVLKKLLREE